MEYFIANTYLVAADSKKERTEVDPSTNGQGQGEERARARGEKTGGSGITVHTCR